MSSSVQTLRIGDISAPDKPSAAGPGALARAVALHLAGKREEALDQLQRAASANQGSAEIYRAMGHIEFELGALRRRRQELPLPHAPEAAVRPGVVQPGRVPGTFKRLGQVRRGLPQRQHA